MILNLYSVKDSCSGEFYSIDIFKNDQLAVRNFNNLCSKSAIGSDLSLYRLGTYNTETGEINSKVDFIQNGVKSEV